VPRRGAKSEAPYRMSPLSRWSARRFAEYSLLRADKEP